MCECVSQSVSQPVSQSVSQSASLGVPGLMTEGFGNVVAGLLGTTSGVTSYSGNVMAVGLTKVSVWHCDVMADGLTKVSVIMTSWPSARQR